MSDPTITKNAKRALSLALKDERVGFAIKVGMIGGAYEAFLAEIVVAITVERERCANMAEHHGDDIVADFIRNGQ